MKILFLLLILCLMIPVTAYSQISEPNNVSTPPQVQSTQCLDFNQDGICEYIILANGTQLENPKQKQVEQVEIRPGEKLWQRELDGKIYTDITAYRHALEAKEEAEAEEFDEKWDEDDDSNNNDNDNDDKGDEDSDDGEDEDIVYCEGQRVPDGADSCYDQYDFEEGDGSGCDDNDDYCNEEDECGRSDVDCIDDRGFDEDDYNG